MIGRARSIALAGLAGHVVEVEAHLAASLPGFTIVGLPDASLQESRDRVRAAVASLGELAQLLGNELAIPAPASAVRSQPELPNPPQLADLAEVRGQEAARFALATAAAGGHHLLMVGPPGAGKTMLASRMVGLLPDLLVDDAVTVTGIHSLCGTFDPDEGLIRRPPFEAPHHSASAAAIVGGGSMMARPGAISRAHAGVLFLDEAPEFPARVLDTLRQPLESGEIVLHRAYGAARYPARFQLVLAANPCPCGNKGVRGKTCNCTALQQRRYFGRLSGPLLDRIDIHIDVAPVRRGAQEGEPTAVVAERVARARAAARERLAGTGWVQNSQVSARWLRANTPGASLEAGQAALDRGALSARGLDRCLRVAWSIADLAGQVVPTRGDVMQALGLRNAGTP